MIPTGTPENSTGVRIDAALHAYRGERSSFAHQLDLYYRLAVHIALQGTAAREAVGARRDRRRQLEAVLLLPHALWVNAGEMHLDIDQVAAAAVDRFANAFEGDADLARVRAVFDEMATYLSDTDRLYGQLRDLSLEAVYRPVGDTFQEQNQLITHAARGWWFLYDRHGRWLGADEQSQRVRYGGSNWRQNAAFIRMVAVSVERFARP